MNVSDTIHFYFAEQLIVSSTLNEIEWFDLISSFERK